METINSKISQLPTEQKKWLLSVKNTFQTAFYGDYISTSKLIQAIKLKAIERDYLEIGLLLGSDDLEAYFKY